MTHKINPYVICRISSLNTQLNKPTNLNSVKVPKVVKPTNKNAITKRWGLV